MDGVGIEPTPSTKKVYTSNIRPQSSLTNTVAVPRGGGLEPTPTSYMLFLYNVVIPMLYNMLFLYKSSHTLERLGVYQLLWPPK